MPRALPQEPDGPAATTLPATAIVIGNMVGTGLFTSLGFQVAEIPSGFALLALWALGGVIALCGALSYAELASAFPRSGGEYNFLGRLFHPLAGFLAGWISLTVGFAAPGALAAMAFGAYLHRVFPAIGVLPAALALIGTTTVWFLFPLRVGHRALSAFVTLHVMVLGAVVLVAFLGPGAGDAVFAPTSQDFSADRLGPFAVALIFVMYSYSGWNAAAYVVGDVADPRRTVPRALVLGTLVVTALYVGVNAAFLHAAPMEELAGELEVGLIAARHLFGETGADLMAVVISIGLVTTVAAMTWAGPRVALVMGEDHPGLAFFARRTTAGVPRNAVLWQGAISVLLLVTSTFAAVLTYTEFVLLLSSFLTVAGVIVLRRRVPKPNWPYRTWGYPVTPLLFLTMTFFIMVFVLRERPEECLWGLTTIALGVVVWAVAGRKRSDG